MTGGGETVRMGRRAVMLSRAGEEGAVAVIHRFAVLLLAALAASPGGAFAGGWSAGRQSVVADAAMRGDAAEMRTLLHAGGDVNAAQGDGMTALHWAARRADAEMARMLIAAGANVAAATRIGEYRPLHMAAEAAAGPVVRVLLQAGADPSAVTTTGGATPLHLAAAAGSREAVAALLDGGAQLDARDGARRQTPLMFAAAYNRVDALDELLTRGADHNLTALVIDVAARDQADEVDRRRRRQRREALEALEAPAASASAPAPARATPVYEPNEEEPLSYADLVGRHGGLTALLHAAREGHAEAVDRLLEAGADIDQVSAGDHTSPMLLALINGHFDLALRLLDKGADPRLASDAGTTALYAVLNAQWAPKARYPQQQAYRQQQASYLEVMEALLEAGADPDARLTKHLWYMSFNFDLLRVDTKGATPFWRAAYATDVEAMRLLIAYGADPGIPTSKAAARFRRRRDTDGPDPSGLPPVPVGGPAVYPIHAASGAGYGEGYAANAHRHVPGGWIPAVRYLVEELGADVNERDLNGYTPLHHAAARGDNELIRYLAEHGADVTAVSRRGQTTVDMANGPVQRIQPFPETVALLESLGAMNNHNCVSC